MVTLLGLALAAAPECNGAVGTEELLGLTGRAELAWSRMEAEHFAQDIAQLDRLVPCADAQLPAPVVASVFRVRALEAYLAGRTDDARAWLGSAAGALPGHSLPSALAPADHPLRALEDEAREATWTTRVLTAPSEGFLVVDGHLGRAAPTDRPFVMQWLDDGGQARLTAVVHPGEAPPTYPVWRFSPHGFDDTRFARVRKQRRIGRLVNVFSATSLAGGVGLFAYGLGDKVNRVPSQDWGIALGALGWAGMLTGQGLNTGATLRETRMIRSLGYDPGGGRVGQSRGLLGASSVTMVLPPVGLTLWGASATQIMNQTRRNRQILERVSVEEGSE